MSYLIVEDPSLCFLPFSSFSTSTGGRVCEEILSFSQPSEETSPLRSPFCTLTRSRSLRPTSWSRFEIYGEPAAASTVYRRRL